MPDQSKALNPKYLTTTQDTYKPVMGEDITEMYQPDWVKMDRHVLRFMGFFKESVVESRVENSRIRELVIFYYLEDNTISINEKKFENSGIPQGPFLKRQKFSKPDKSFLTPYDLVVGKNIQIFGKNILICDCDQYTREFYDNLGIEVQSPPISIPSDQFSIMYSKKGERGGNVAKLGEERVTSQKQFLENDRKVLKFYVFSEIPCIMHYYLADDTLDISEVKMQNSGRDSFFSLLLKRMKMPRQFNLNQPGQTHKSDFIKPEDIRVCFLVANRIVWR